MQGDLRLHCRDIRRRATKYFRYAHPPRVRILLAAWGNVSLEAKKYRKKVKQVEK